MAKRIREKSELLKQNKDTRPYASVRYVRLAPTKAKIVIDQVRGKSYDDVLDFCSSSSCSQCNPLDLDSRAGEEQIVTNCTTQLNYISYDLQDELYKLWLPLRTHGRYWLCLCVSRLWGGSRRECTFLLSRLQQEV